MEQQLIKDILAKRSKSLKKEEDPIIR